MKKYQEVLNNLPDFLRKYPWLSVEDDYVDQSMVIVDDMLTGNADDYGSYSAVAEGISNGGNSGKPLADYIATFSPLNVQGLLDSIQRVRDYHQTSTAAVDTDPRCQCGQFAPCLTIQALDGAQ